MRLKSPLDQDTLLLTGFTGREGISELFLFEVDAVAVLGTPIDFADLLGKGVTIETDPPGQPKRFFHGIISKVKQSGRDETFDYYRLEVRPKLWLATLNQQCRIFQQMTVPQILEELLAPFHPRLELSTHYLPHNYCVQYQESDADFAFRLMEEEGIYYYFTHSGDDHQLVIRDLSQTSNKIEGEAIPFVTVEGGTRGSRHVYRWEKSQELHAGKFSLGDYSFELPSQSLEVEETIASSINAGSVSHSLALAVNKPIEVYSYPGDFAHRCDSVGPNGTDQQPDLQNLFSLRTHIAKLHSEEAAVRSLIIDGKSTAVGLVPGLAMSLVGHFHADGHYLITSVRHRVTLPDYRSTSQDQTDYENSFTVIPVGMAYRPPRSTAVPKVHGTQTGVVVGPEGEEIFTDKYGRVKVHFHWDRRHDKGTQSSCWVRVSQAWAGHSWGMMTLPRIGQEVVVAFLDGDPDAPLVVGSVYNADQMPPYALPGNRTLTGLKSHSRGGTAANYSEMQIDDTLGKEMFQFHAERDMKTTVENDHHVEIGNDYNLVTKKNKSESVNGNYSIVVGGGALGGGGGGGDPLSFQAKNVLHDLVNNGTLENRPGESGLAENGPAVPAVTGVAYGDQPGSAVAANSANGGLGEGSGGGGDALSPSFLPNWNISTPVLTTTVGFLNEQACIGQQTAFVFGNFLNMSNLSTIEVFTGFQFEMRYPSFTEWHDGVFSISMFKKRFSEADKSEDCIGAMTLTAGTTLDVTAATGPLSLASGGTLLASSLGAMAFSVGAEMSLQTGALMNIDVGAEMNLAVAGIANANVGGMMNLTCGGVATIKAPAILLSCGDSSISITPAGIMINAPTLSINVDSEYSFNGVLQYKSLGEMSAQVMAMYS